MGLLVLLEVQHGLNLLVLTCQNRKNPPKAALPRFLELTRLQRIARAHRNGCPQGLPLWNAYLRAGCPVSTKIVIYKGSAIRCRLIH